MVTLRSMRGDEFPAYLAYFIADYAAEIVASHGLTDAEALAQAKREAAAGLPDGPATAGQVLLCVLGEEEEAGTVLGYVWHRPDEAAGSVFLLDFHILPAHQGKGYGKAALAALEASLSDAGFRRIQLRVAAGNDRARHLYESGGFRPTGTNMSKPLGRA